MSPARENDQCGTHLLWASPGSVPSRRFLFNWLLLLTWMVTTFQSRCLWGDYWRMLARLPLFIDEFVGAVTSRRSTFLSKQRRSIPRKLSSILNNPSRRAHDLLSASVRPGGMCPPNRLFLYFSTTRPFGHSSHLPTSPPLLKKPSRLAGTDA